MAFWRVWSPSPQAAATWNAAAPLPPDSLEPLCTKAGVFFFCWNVSFFFFVFWIGGQAGVEKMA